MRKEKKGEVVAWLLLAGSLALLLYLNIFHHDNRLNSDMAAEMIFSKELMETGHFFATPDWYYSTEFRFLYTHWIMGPLFHVFKSWHVIRALTNLITYGLMLASYFFFMKPFRVRRSLVIGSSVLLLLPFSETMMLHMQMGNTYMFHVIISFLFMGCFVRITNREAGQKQALEGKKQASVKTQQSSRKACWLVAYVILGVICGVSGVRYLLALQCPLVIAMFVFSLKSAEFKTFRQELAKENWKGKCKEFLRGSQLTYLWYAILGAFAAVMGYGINVFYVCSKYVFQTYEVTNFVSVYEGVFLDRVQNAFGSLLMLFGYVPDRGVLSLQGLISMISFVLIAIFGWIAVSCAKAEKGQRDMLVTFFWVQLFVNVFVFLFSTNTMVPRYYITIYIFLLPLLCFYLEKEERFFDRVVVVGLLTICLATTTGKETLSFVKSERNTELKKVATALKESGLHFGYASYWNANILTELTDGEVEVANVADAQSVEFFRWSSPARYYDEPYDGPVFLLLTASECIEARYAPSVRSGEIIFDNGVFVILKYESQQALLELRKTE